MELDWFKLAEFCDQLHDFNVSIWKLKNNNKQICLSNQADAWGKIKKQLNYYQELLDKRRKKQKENKFNVS